MLTGISCRPGWFISSQLLSCCSVLLCLGLHKTVCNRFKLISGKCVRNIFTFKQVNNHCKNVACLAVFPRFTSLRSLPFQPLSHKSYEHDINFKIIWDKRPYLLLFDDVTLWTWKRPTQTSTSPRLRAEIHVQTLQPSINAVYGLHIKPLYCLHHASGCSCHWFVCLRTALFSKHSFSS